jgi:hypothetical protein
MAGYSGRPLVEKLGIKPGAAVAIVGAPPDYAATLGALPAGVSLRAAARGPLDWIQLFVRRRADLERRLPALARALRPDGALWVSWPKRASGVATDLTEDGVRAVALAHRLVDVKVCAVDDVWSGLKLVVRLADRPARSAGGARTRR